MNAKETYAVGITDTAKRLHITCFHTFYHDFFCVCNKAINPSGPKLGGFFMSKNTTSIQTKRLVFCAMAIALATVISVVIKLPSLPNGGSVTLFSMLIICLTGYWYGPTVGLITAFAYGILQFITGPYVVHPVQVLLDYPLAFGALGLSGFFWKSKNGLLKGYVVGVLGRLIMHNISGYIFYTTYVSGDFGANMTAIWASTVYNMSYILPEMILTLVLIALPPVNKVLNRIKVLATE